MTVDKKLDGLEQGEERRGLGRMKAIAAGAGAPVRRFLERRAEELLVEAECLEIRARVDGELQELHDRIWNDWGPNVFAAAKRRLEEERNEQTEQ